MSDAFDRASDLEIAEREAAIAAVRQAVSVGESATHCNQCDEPIPQARREALPGVRHCIHCQTVSERSRYWQKHYRLA